jgi:hypothetical protein
MTPLSVASILLVVALVLALIDAVRSQSLTSVAVVLVCVVLLLR